MRQIQPRIRAANLLRVRVMTTGMVRMTGRRLQRRNRNWLTMHPLCVHCEAKGLVVAAAEVDHVIPLEQGGPDDETNLQGLCHACHKAKTAAEARKRGAGATLAPSRAESPEESM